MRFTIEATASDVEEELSRRLERGFEFEGHYFQARDKDPIADHASQASAAMIHEGISSDDPCWQDGKTKFEWIASNNQFVGLDAGTMIRLGKAAAAFRSRMKIAARRLKDRIAAGETFPNISDDALWR
jgi:hypothetical protein